MSSRSLRPGGSVDDDEEKSNSGHSAPAQGTSVPKVTTAADDQPEDGMTMPGTTNQANANAATSTNSTASTATLNETSANILGSMRRWRNGYIADGGSSFNPGPPGYNPAEHETASDGLNRIIIEARAAPRAPLPHVMPPLLSGRHPLPTGRVPKENQPSNNTTAATPEKKGGKEGGKKQDSEMEGEEE